MPGNYTIYASTNYQNTVTDSENNKYYDKIENSNTILLTVNYDTEDYNITADGIETFKVNGEITTKGIINNLSNKSLNILDGKKCYFHIPKLNKTYTGTLTKEGNTLVGTPNEMSIPIAGLYEL